jgi:hypothetical protein
MFKFSNFYITLLPQHGSATTKKDYPSIAPMLILFIEAVSFPSKKMAIF